MRDRAAVSSGGSYPPGRQFESDSRNQNMAFAMDCWFVFETNRSRFES